MPIAEFNTSDIKVFLNHIYEFKKGVRPMILYTVNRKYLEFAIKRLEDQNIDYVIQEVDERHLNLFFGKKECMNVIRTMVTRPVNELTPEEDFILGAMLGYDISAQCDRFCQRKSQQKEFNSYSA